MKLVILLFISLFIFLFGGNTHKNDLEKDHINGKVKTIIDSITPIRVANIDTFLEIHVSNYNGKGGLTSESTYGVSSKDYYCDSLKYTNTHEVEISHFNKKNKLAGLSIYYCDSNWNKKKLLDYDSDGMLSNIDSLIYDKNGLLIEVTSGYFGMRLSSSNKRLIKFDTTDICIDYANYTRSSITKYKYDHLDNIQEDDYYLSYNTFPIRTRYKYDEKGNRIEVKAYKGDWKLSAIYSCQYEDFDEKGNWQKMVRTHYGEVESITKRKIVYY